MLNLSLTVVKTRRSQRSALSPKIGKLKDGHTRTSSVCSRISKSRGPSGFGNSLDL